MLNACINPTKNGPLKLKKNKLRLAQTEEIQKNGLRSSLTTKKEKRKNDQGLKMYLGWECLSLISLDFLDYVKKCIVDIFHLTYMFS